MDLTDRIKAAQRALEVAKIAMANLAEAQEQITALSADLGAADPLLVAAAEELAKAASGALDAALIAEDLPAHIKHRAITEGLEAGRTVDICTATKTTRITPGNWRRWKEINTQMFRLDGRSLYLRHGKRWACIDWCGIVIHP